MKICKATDYRERISAASIFESLRYIIRNGDSVQIDVDFLGYHQDYVKLCLKRLLNKFNNNDPTIDFLSKRQATWVKHVKEADKKSKLARHKDLKKPPVKDCPDLSPLLIVLKTH